MSRARGRSSRVVAGSRASWLEEGECCCVCRLLLAPTPGGRRSASMIIVPARRIGPPLPCGGGSARAAHSLRLLWLARCLPFIARCQAGSSMLARILAEKRVHSRGRPPTTSSGELSRNSAPPPRCFFLPNALIPATQVPSARSLDPNTTNRTVQLGLGAVRGGGQNDPKRQQRPPARRALTARFGPKRIIVCAPRPLPTHNARCCAEAQAVAATSPHPLLGLLRPSAAPRP